MAPSTQAAGQKRKFAFDRPGQSANARKRQKNQDARNIPVQPAAAALAANGELNVASFIKAREFEIGSLERSMQKARKSLTTRAFQQVPRHMRRRTASHNAKKVPRRLRKRAEREMKDDNTPTVTKRTRTPSRKMRIRLETAKAIRKISQKTKTVRQKKREAKANAKQADPENHVVISRVPRLKKNILAEPPNATTKYKKRQVNKTWLPTHLWHTKRAHMTRPTKPLWRMAIPLSPTEKSYRPSHRAAGSRGCIAWDTSYMSTVACRGTEHALDNLLAALGFKAQGLSASLQKKWKSGTRFAEGWVYEQEGERRPVSPVTVIWCIQPKEKERAAHAPNADDVMEVDTSDQTGPSEPQIIKKQKVRLDQLLLIRLHPSACQQFWQQLLKAAKSQRPQVLVEDLRFEIGSLEIQGPGSTESLLGVLRPFNGSDETSDLMATLWTSLAGLNNPGILPQNAILSFDIVDPRLSHPPKRIQLPKESDTNQLNEILVSWPADKELSSSRLMSHKERWMVSNSLPSQKAINRRKALAPPGHAPATTPKDPRIPVMLLASRAEDVSGRKGSNLQGTWTILLPWSCVDAVWRSLMYYPLTAGGTPRFGGLHEKQQLAFENKAPWFPGDLPGTDAGKAWERTQSEKRFDEWIRRPPKHRIAWDKLDLGPGKTGEVGRGWACDWEYLFEGKKGNTSTDDVAEISTTKDMSMAKTVKPLLTQRQRKAAQAAAEASKEEASRRRNTSSPESEDEARAASIPAEINYTQLSPSAALALLKTVSGVQLPSTPTLMTVRITLLDKGTPSPAARIYRLPSAPPTQKIASSVHQSSEATPPTQPPSWSSVPPPAQRPPVPSTTDSSSSSMSSASLRERWLALDPSSSQHGVPNASGAHRLKKQKTNRFNLPRQQHADPRESLAKINVLPKDAPAEIIAKFGPDSAFGRGDGEIPKERPPQGRKLKGQGRGQQGPTSGKGNANANANDNKDKDKHKAAAGPEQLPSDTDVGRNPYLDPTDTPIPNFRTELADLMVPNPSGTQTQWTKHPPCPDVEDLIGFVTSGGYNLSEGRGTAIGAVWAQRVIEGWIAEGAISLGKGTSNIDTKDKDKDKNKDPERQRQRKRQRRLCIVRNSGESIGRLGIWECCE
ncbi:hypothetical protein A1O1_09142 [Capronia coronata CBS 617.96]|uniref:Uncharacterized protein n=1 Tax=Capronia coronata CBS 617.96 TaxID=1182541 RepID=W9XN28_9EURO|nr:uncharacterized protein A1O1_09142 [Capronia coronata CBS 617.96]EXJ78740.1 hypothetical protein A1O1_09142 [Capronia coronata CBS 617.96]